MPIMRLVWGRELRDPKVLPWKTVARTTMQGTIAHTFNPYIVLVIGGTRPILTPSLVWHGGV